jgi:protein-disulfide isomerase
MAKRARRTRRTAQTEDRGTNWWIIGGIAGVGIIALFALLFMTLQAGDSPEPTSVPFQGQPLAEYCEENPDRCMTKGAEDAPVTIVEISDYGCGHCKNFNLDTAGLIDDLYVTPGQVKWVVLPFALGPGTVPASAAAMCAAEQDTFYPYHTQLFRQQGDADFMTKANFRRAAETVGLDVDAFSECIDDGRYNNTVQLNSIAAAETGVNSTPTFFINGKVLPGNQPLPAFQQEINAILEAADAN